MFQEISVQRCRWREGGGVSRCWFVKGVYVLDGETGDNILILLAVVRPQADLRVDNE